MSEIVDSGQESGHQSLPIEASIPVVALADHQVLINYIKRVIPALLEDDNSIHPSLEAILHTESTADKLKKFISDGQMRSLLIQRLSSKGLSSNG